jgi:murein DD-endopeptidase MepM/ murein hydrolase activator NlpD
MKILELTKYLIFSLVVLSCSTLKSGKYIQLKEGDSFASLSKDYQVPQWKLEVANKGRKIASGEWIFIPLNRGVLSSTSNITEDYLSYNGEFAWPVPSSKKVTSKFGKRWGKNHEGIDIAARVGTSIVAVDDGVIIYSGNDLSGYGNLTVISHSGGLFSVYAHAKKNFTQRGQNVYKGQVIAQVGMTGRTTGPHLHFEVRHDSKAINPLDFMAYSEND